jgi:signal transduction histidine kinase
MELNEYLASSASTDYFFIWEAGTQSISYLSPSFDQLSTKGLSNEQIVLELMDEESTEYFRQMMDKLEELNYRVDEEIRGNHRKYGIEWLRLKTFPFYDENVISKVAIQFTVLQKQKRQLSDTAQESDTIDDMLEAVTQDLWGAVSNIISFAKIMESEHKSQNYEDFDHYISNIIKIGFETKDVIATVLRLMDIEKGNQQLNLEVISLETFLSKTAALLDAKFKDFSVDVKKTLPQHIGQLSIDQKRFTQVFENLVSNLAKSTVIGGVINFSAEKSGDHVQIMISNATTVENGQINDQEPYRNYYVEPEHDIENASGLEITKRIIGLHNGKLWVERKKELGTAFFIELPFLE